MHLGCRPQHPPVVGVRQVVQVLAPGGQWEAREQQVPLQRPQQRPSARASARAPQERAGRAPVPATDRLAARRTCRAPSFLPHCPFLASGPRGRPAAPACPQRHCLREGRPPHASSAVATATPEPRRRRWGTTGPGAPPHTFLAPAPVHGRTVPQVRGPCAPARCAPRTRACNGPGWGTQTGRGPRGPR